MPNNALHGREAGDFALDHREAWVRPSTPGIIKGDVRAQPRVRSDVPPYSGILSITGSIQAEKVRASSSEICPTKLKI